MSWIDICAGEYSVFNLLQTSIVARNAIHSQEFYVFLLSQFLCCIVCSNGTDVAMTEHYVNLLSFLQIFFHLSIAIFRCPVGFGIEIIYIMLLNDLAKAFMTILSWRHRQLSCHFPHDRFSANRVHNIILYHVHSITCKFASCIFVVTTDKGCIVVRLCFSIKQHHWNAFLLRFFKRRSKLGVFVRCHDKQINIGINQTVDLLNLQRRVFVTVGYRYVGLAIIQTVSSQQFHVHFIAPCTT